MTKKIYLMLLSVFLSVTYISAQVVQTVNVPQGGGLATAIGSNLKTVTDLTLTGTINAADFNTIKQMTALKNLDMSKVSIVDNLLPNQAFRGRVLNSVILPKGLKTFGNECFASSNIISLDLPEGLTNIGSSAFNSAVLKEPLKLPSSITQLDAYCFSSFNGTVDFSTIKNSLTTIAGAVFYNYSKVLMPELDFSGFNNLKNFGELHARGAFAGYSGHVILPNNMERLPDFIFKGFTGRVTLPKGLKTFGNECFASSNMISLDLPEGLTNIGSSAFNSAVLKEPLKLPSSITQLDAYCFSNFNGTVDFSAVKNSLTTIAGAAFFNYSKELMPELDFHEFNNLKNYGELHAKGVFAGYSGHVILPNNMERLPDFIFKGFTGTVTLPKGLKTFGNECFASSNIISLDLPEGLTNIGSSAFNSAVLKEPLKLPSSITQLDAYCFSNFNGTVDFSAVKNSLTTIAGAAFFNYSKELMPELDFHEFNNLKNYGELHAKGVFAGYSGHVILPNNMERLPDFIFKGFTGKATLPKSLKTFGNECFASSNMISLDLPEGLTNIGSSAFNSAVLKEPLKLPSSITRLDAYCFSAFNGTVDFSAAKNSLTTIAGAAFFNYSKELMPELDFSEFNNLKKLGEIHSRGAFTAYSGHVILPNNMERLPDYSFKGFTGTVTLPKGLKTIGNFVFQESTITSIELHSSVSSIGNMAFYNATKVGKIISNNPTPPALGTNVFYGVDKETTKLEVPSSSINLYGSAAQWKDFLNVKVVVPSKLDLTYKINTGYRNYKTGLIQPGKPDTVASYQAIRIGEYYWMNTNFNHKEPNIYYTYDTINFRQGSGFENSIPLKQTILDKYLDQVLLDKSKFQVDIDTFTKDYGNYYSIETRNYMNELGKIYENCKTSASNWKMPTLSDVRQLMAMSPFAENNAHRHLSHFDVMYALNAKSTTNEMSKYVVPGRCGSTYWFDYGDVGGNKYGFSLMPNGARQHADYFWNTILCTTPKGKYETLDSPKGHIFQLFYIARFTTQDGDIIINDQITTEPVQSAWQTVRWCRILSDEELGYKLYINIPNIDKNLPEWISFVKGNEIPLLNYLRNNCIDTDQTSILKLGLNESAPEGYIELPHGYIRGFYVQNILDNPESQVTDGEVVEYAYNVEDSALQYNYNKPTERESLKVCSTSTRSLVSDEVAVPFKSDASVTLYPNPVQDVLNISGEGVERVSIYDMSGRQLSTAKNVNTISVSDLSKGTYLIRVLTANGESTHKVIKK